MPTDADEAIRAEQRLAKVLSRYEGRWVAVKDHEVFADSATLEDILDRVRDHEVDGVLKVGRGERLSFF